MQNAKILATFMFLALSCPFILRAEGRHESAPATEAVPTASTSVSPDESSDSALASVVDGLHVTGAPIPVDIRSYRLSVTGTVARPLMLQFGELKSMDMVKETAAVDCPGFFIDTGTWTGVRLRDLLSMAQPSAGSTTVTFVSIDGGYSQQLSFDRAMRDDTLIAYEFNGKQFDSRNGFPLRLVAPGETGAIWVKWLGKIEVSSTEKAPPP